MSKVLMAGRYLDGLIASNEDHGFAKDDQLSVAGQLGCTCLSAFSGSVDNPLRVLANLCMERDGLTGAFGYPSDTLARIVGCPVEMLTAWRLKGDFKECVTVAGKLALIMLGSMRNDALAYCFEDDTEEDPLEALTALAEILGNIDGKTLNDIQNNTMDLGLITEVTDRFEQRAAA